MNRDLLYLHSFNLILFENYRALKLLRRYFPTMEDAWRASHADLSASGLREKIVSQIITKRQQLDPEKEFLRLQKLGLGILVPTDKFYPPLLREIHSPPQLLYLRGQAELCASKNILSVVGSRKMTAYGKRVIADLVSELARNDITIVSGLALGVDQEAHTKTLEVEGKTIAVMASGLNDDNLYPRENYRLAKRISEIGALVSEYPPFVAPHKHHFPIRNRIIAGISHGTLVMEAADKSGALITAFQALEENREVFAIPGNIDSPQSAGTNKLIKLGAKLVTSASDILEELDLSSQQSYTKKDSYSPSSPQEATILNILSQGPRYLDEIKSLSALPINELNTILASLEINDIIKNLGGQQYILNQSVK